jgi:drug/metabolite transporter (DMT)-like permease
MKFRVWLLTGVVVLANVGGNAILGYAMKQAPASAGVIGSILQPVAILGIVVLTTWMLLRMRLLGLADLSFVVPVTACGYVLSALAGVFFLHEQVPARGWIGTVIIMVGATLTGLTEHSADTPADKLAAAPQDSTKAGSR